MDDSNNRRSYYNGEYSLSLAHQYIAKASEIFAPIMYLNFFTVLFFSTLWALYLIPKLWKDYRNEKITSKLRNNQPEYLWINKMENFKSNRIKNIFLFCICLSEIGATIAIVFSITLQIPLFFSDGARLDLLLQDPSTSFPIYCELIESSIFRFICSITTTSICASVFFIRILTQYMVHQYSYYKDLLKLNFKVYISLTCLSIIFLMATLYTLLTIYNICIVLILSYEYIQLIIESRKLHLLLRQRLFDAVNHENQSNSVILYYQIAYKEYKYCSTIMLVALFAQYTGVSIYLLKQFVLNFIEQCSYRCTVFSHINLYSEFTGFSQLILITFGTSIQIVLYLIVSIRRLFRYIYKRVNLNKQISSSRSSLQLLIAKHNLAYLRRNR